MLVFMVGSNAETYFSMPLQTARKQVRNFFYFTDTAQLRWQIEQLFDTMRNTCGLDTSSMQDDEGFNAWSFINHVTLIVACRVLALVRQKKLAKEYSQKE